MITRRALVLFMALVASLNIYRGWGYSDHIIDELFDSKQENSGYGFEAAESSLASSTLRRSLLTQSCKKYQRTDVRAIATFTIPGLPAQSAYVTDLVTFNSSDADVASVNGSVVSGLSPGRTEITVTNHSAYTVVAPDLVEVSDTKVNIASLSVAAITSATLTGNSTVGDVFTPTFELDQTLTEYGQRAGVSVTANFDDGTFMDITHEAELTSLVPGVLEVVTDDPDGPMVEVVEGAWTVGLGKLLNATWDFSRSLLIGGTGGAAPSGGTCDDPTVANGQGNVAVDIPPPTSQPTMLDTSPTSIPSSQPSIPTSTPTSTPTGQPTKNTTQPTGAPTGVPTVIAGLPTSAPVIASAAPTSAPSVAGGAVLTSAPTPAPSVEAALSEAPTTTVTIPSPEPTSAPTSVPTPRNITATLRPTATLTHSPTITGPTLDIFDSLSKLHPEIYPSAGFSIPVKNETYLMGTNDLGVIYGRPYDALFGSVPGTKGEYFIEMGDIQYTASNQKVTYTTDKLPVASVTAVVKTTVVYSSYSTVSLAYQVADVYGAAQVITTGLSITMTLTVTSGALTGTAQTYACTSPSSDTGIGSCVADPGMTWFNASADTSVSVSVSATHAGMPAPGYVTYAPAVGVTFRQTVTYKPVTPGSVGLLMTISRPEPKFPDTAFTSTLTVATGVHALHTWVVRVTYDSSVVSFVKADTSSLYVAAVVTFPSSNEVVLSSASPAAGKTDDMLSGDAVPLVTISWVVNGEDVVSPGHHSNAISAVAEDLVNSYTMKFAGNVAAQINGEVTTSTSSSTATLTQGQITVLHTNINGILVYSAQNEWVNTAPATGVTVTSPITVLGVTNRVGTSLDVSVSASSNCYIANTAMDSHILDPSGCVAKMNATHTGGAGNVYVGVSHSTTVVATDGSSTTVIHSALAVYHVWFYIETELSVADKVLNLILV